MQSRAALARRLGVSRAHVTQVLRLLQLPPEVQQTVLALGDPIEVGRLGVHRLQSLGKKPPEEREQRMGQLTARLITRA